MPAASSDLSDYYANAGYTVPTDAVCGTATHPTDIPSPRPAGGTSITSTIPMSSKVTTPTSSAFSATNRTSSPSSDLSAGVKAGIGVGGAALGAHFMVLVAFIFWTRQRRNLRDHMDHTSGTGGHRNNSQTRDDEQRMQVYTKGEMPTDSERIGLAPRIPKTAELEVESARTEMEARGRKQLREMAG
ncbi:MAG: hypothetical protein Q9218_003525 [Villophora microphyllina]